MAAAFLEPEKYRGVVIPVYDEMLTCNQLVETFTEVTGIKATCAQCGCPSLLTRHAREHQHAGAVFIGSRHARIWRVAP